MIKKITILSPPQRNTSCENIISQMEAVAQFSYSYRYKKRGKIYVGSLSNLNPPNSPFTLGYRKQSFFSFLLNLILTKTEKEFSYIRRYKLTLFNSFRAVKLLWKIAFGNSPWRGTTFLQLTQMYSIKKYEILLSH